MAEAIGLVFDLIFELAKAALENPLLKAREVRIIRARSKYRLVASGVRGDCISAVENNLERPQLSSKVYITSFQETLVT